MSIDMQIRAAFAIIGLVTFLSWSAMAEDTYGTYR